jgi:deoxyadenosine/deoxycytidine kinase
VVIVVGGMIGLGKTSVSEILADHFKTEVFYESVEDNPILPLFYTASEKEIQEKRYPFLLQLHFLNSRFRAIKKALGNDNNILDRSIYEDWYFAKKNVELGRISSIEMTIYEDLLENMMEELNELPKKAPDLMVYLKGPFEVVLERIMKRGRSYEVDDSLVAYYKFLWQGYDDWVMNCYKASDVVVIDMGQLDVIGNINDRRKLIQMVEGKLREIRAYKQTPL